MAQNSLLKACCTKFGLITIGVLALMGCTRNSLNPSDGKVTIALPSAQSLSAKNQKYMDYKGLSPADRKVGSGATYIAEATTGAVATVATAHVQVLVVNVTGSGIGSPVFYQWSANDPTASPPTSVTLNVPQGSARQIQVLEVLQSSTGMVFDFGTTTMDLSSTTASADVSLTPIGTSTGIQGQIMGRYLASGGVGPTDKLNVFITPTAGATPLLVDSTEMFGGYFQVFGMSDVPFTYALNDGTVLYQNLELSAVATNPLLNGNPANPAVLYVPPVYWTGSTDTEQKSAKLEFVGYFGPGTTASEKTCFDPSGTLSGAYTDPLNPGTSTFQWSVAPSGTTGMTVLQSLVASQTAGVVTGGAGVNCPTGTGTSSPANYLYVPIADVGNGDLGFRGPFLPVDANNNFLSFANDGSGGLNVSWKSIPSATVDLTGFRVFYKYPSGNVANGNQPYQGNNNSVYCDRLVSEFGFTDLGSTYSTGTSVANITGHSATDDIEVVVCPAKDSFWGLSTALFQTAVLGNPNGPSSGPLPPGPATQLMATSQGFPQNGFSYNSCQSLSFYVADANGQMTTGPASLQVQLSLNGTPQLISSNPSDCTTTSFIGSMGGGAATTLTFNAVAGGSYQIYFVPASFTGTIVGTGATNTMSLANVSAPNLSAFNFVGWNVYPQSEVLPNFGMAMNSILPNVCYPMSVFGSNLAGVVQTYISGGITLGLASTGPITVYSNAGCTTAWTGTATFPNTTPNSINFWIKASGTGTGTITASWGAYSPTNYAPTTISMNVSTGSTVPTSLMISNFNANNMIVGACSKQPMTFSLMNNYGTSVTAPAGGQVVSVPSNFVLYSDPTCTTLASSIATGGGTVTIPQGISQANYFFKGIAEGASSLAFTSTGLTSMPTTMSYSITASCGSYGLNANYIANSQTSGGATTVLQDNANNSGCSFKSVQGSAESYPFYGVMDVNHISGKIYYEVSIDALDTAAGASIGIGFGGPSLTGVPATSAYSARSLGLGLPQNINAAVYNVGPGLSASSASCQQNVSGTPALNLNCAVLPAGAGSVVGVAVDTTTGSIWWSVNGVWFAPPFSGSVAISNGPSLPGSAMATISEVATYTYGYPIITITSPVGSGVNQATLTTKGAGMRYTPPSGFMAPE